MRIRAIVLLVFFAAAPVVAQAPQSITPKQVTVTARSANIRTGPSTRASVIVIVPRGEVLDVYAYEPNTRWYMVSARGFGGWISEKVTEPAEELLRFGQWSNSISPAETSADLEAKGWVRYATNANGEHFYKPSAIEVSGQMTKVWVRAVGTQGSTGSFLALHCARREFLLLESIEYDANGKVTKTNNFSDIARPGAIPPDSLMFQLARVVCKRDVDFY